MNSVEIRYSYLSQKAQLYINGEKASPYSKVSALLGRSFIESAEHIVGSLDEEIYDEYEIDFYGSDFQYKILAGMVKNSEYCKNIRFHETDSLFSREGLIQRLKSVGENHNISVDSCESLKIYCSDDIAISRYFKRTDTPDADIGIFSDGSEIPSSITIPVLYGDSFCIKKIGGRNCCVLPADGLDIFFEYCETEFIVRPLVAEYLTACKYTQLDDSEQVELEAIKSNSPAYYIGDIPQTMDVGETFGVKFECFPEHSFSLKSVAPNILSCTDCKITASNAGSGSVIVTDGNGDTVLSRAISVIEHRYAEEIRLVPRFEYLKRSERNIIDVIVTPYNAEDTDELVWSISNPKVLQADDSGNVIALEEGKTAITVAGKRVSASLTVEVKPALQGLKFDEQSVRIKNGETVILECSVIPQNAPTENLTWEIDNKTIASINPSKNGRRCQVTGATGYEGKGNIRCYDPYSKLGAICNIEVISKVKHTWVGTLTLICMLIGFFFPVLSAASICLGVYGLVQDAEESHRARYIVCSVISVLTIIIWLSSL